MNRVILQLWEESEKGVDVRPDGCSIHLDSLERNKYIDSIYGRRLGISVPKEYERIVGGEIISFIENGLFEILKIQKSIRLSQHELNNLIYTEDLLFSE
jgi:hypothetical protein